MTLLATPGPSVGYIAHDFHRQAGGIWRDKRAAAVYAMGALIVHVGRNDTFELHDAFVATLSPAAAGTRPCLRLRQGDVLAQKGGPSRARRARHTGC